MSKRTGPEELRILVVDDSEISRRIIGTILRSRHWTVCGEAEDGKDGVEKFQELKPDVVLLDLSMPDMTGIEAAQQMSASDPTVRRLFEGEPGVLVIEPPQRHFARRRRYRTLRIPASVVDRVHRRMEMVITKAER